MNESITLDPRNEYIANNLQRLAFGCKNAWDGLAEQLYPSLCAYAESLVQEIGPPEARDRAVDAANDTWLACRKALVEPTHPAVSVASAIEDPTTHDLTLEVVWNRESWKEEKDALKTVVVSITVIGLTQQTNSPVTLSRTDLRFTNECRVRTLEIGQATAHDRVQVDSVRVVVERTVGYFMASLLQRVLRLFGGNQPPDDKQQPPDTREPAPDVNFHNNFVSSAKPAYAAQLSRMEHDYFIMSRRLGFSDSEIARRLGITNYQVHTLALKVERKLAVLEALRLLHRAGRLTSDDEQAVYLEQVKRYKLDDIADEIGCKREKVRRILESGLDKVDAMIAMISLARDQRLDGNDSDFLERWLFDRMTGRQLTDWLKVSPDRFLAIRRTLGCRLHARILTDRDRHKKGLLRGKGAETDQEGDSGAKETGTGKKKERRRAYLELRFVQNRTRAEIAAVDLLGDAGSTALEEQLNEPWRKERTLVSEAKSWSDGWTVPSLVVWP